MPPAPALIVRIADALVVLAGEQQGRAFAAEVLLERRRVALELGFELGVGRLVEQLERGLEVVGAGQQVPPRVDLGAQAVGLAEDLLGGALVVPEPGFLGQRLELGDPLRLGVEVKDAPRSTGSVRPGRGWRTCPPSSGPGDPGAGAGRSSMSRRAVLLRATTGFTQGQ